MASDRDNPRYPDELHRAALASAEASGQAGAQRRALPVSAHLGDDTPAGRIALWLDMYASLGGQDPELIHRGGSHVSDHELVDLRVSDLRAVLTQLGVK